MSEPENGRITFTVKELLGKVDIKLDAISAKLDAKADAVELEKIDGRVVALEREASEVRAVANALLSARKQRFSTAEKIVGLGFAAVSMALSVLSLAPDVIHF